MNSQLLLIFVAISVLFLILLFVMIRNSDRLKPMSKKHLLESIQNDSLSETEKEKKDKQLLSLLKNKNSMDIKLYIILSSTLIAVSFLLYGLVGQPNPTTQTQEPMTMSEAIIELENRLKNKPNDAEGQLLLARSLMSVKDYKKAVEVYRTANELIPNNANILTELAESIALFNNKKSFLGEPEKLLAKAIQINPNQEKALWLYGMTTYERGDLKTTEKTWSRLYSIIQNQGAKDQLLIQLNEVRSKLGIIDLDSNSQNQTDESKTVLSVTVDISKTILESLDAPVFLFVSVKEPNGMPMPIAAKKITLTENTMSLPMTINLTDSDSLLPQRNLSSFDKVKVQAKISLSGTANASNDDIKSEEMIVDLSIVSEVTVTINPN